MSTCGLPARSSQSVIPGKSPQPTLAIGIHLAEEVSWFNHNRLLGPIGYILQYESEVNRYPQLNGLVSTMAYLKSTDRNPTGGQQTPIDGQPLKSR